MSLSVYAKMTDSGIEWVGDVPSHWVEKPLFALVTERDASNAGMIEDNLLSLSYGRIVRKDIENNDGLLPVSFETYQIVEPNDIVWRLTDLQNDQRSLRTALVSERGIITSAYLTTQPCGIVAAFLSYLLRAYDLTKVFYSMGGGLRQSMKFADVKRLPVKLPPDAEQVSIVAFLDRETAKIDALIQEQRRLIALLKEKRQAVISHAVTKGLDPHAPMKDSGIEWLGAVPAHWEVSKLGYHAKLQSGYAFSSTDFGIEGIPLVRMNNLARGRLDLTAAVCIPEASSNYRVALKEGDLIWGMSGSIGETGSLGNFARVSEADLPCQLNQRVGRFVSSKCLSLDYLEFIIQSDAFQKQTLLFVTGTAQFNVSGEQVQSILVTVPPQAEQPVITAFLRRTLSGYAQLVAEAVSSIDLLNERRAALISAAVTGKIDVRGAASAEEREAA